MASGESQWITGAEARRDVQRLRAISDAILTGVGTVLADDPSLTVRREELGDIGDATEPSRQPLRVIADRDARTPSTANILQGGNVQVFCASSTLATAPAQDLAALGISLTGVAWKDNALFNQVSGFIPGGGVEEKVGFIQNIVSTASAPVEAFISKTGMTREKMVDSVKTFTDSSDDALDYVAAFFCASTSYWTQTGVQ